MIITLVKANFSASNIGILNSFAVLTNLGLGCSYNGPSSIERNGSLNATISISNGYVLNDDGLIITMGGNAVTSGITVNDNTITIDISSVTGNIAITVSTKNATPGEEDDDTNISGFTVQPLSLDSASWVNSTVGATGINSVTEGSTNKRLTYNQVFDVPESGRIKVTCADNYQWGVRSGVAEDSMVNNQFWLNNGDELEIASSGAPSKFMIIFRKSSQGGNEAPFSRQTDTSIVETISKSDVAAMNPALYYADSDSAAFDTSDYELVFTPETDASNWALATVSESGIGADGSNQKRLTYTTVLDATLLQEHQVIGVTCADGYQWAVRVSADGGETYPNNCYWYNSGTVIRVGYAGTSPSATSGTKPTNYILVFRKYKESNGGYSGSNDNQFTGKTEAVNIGAKVYTAKAY